MLHTFEKRLGIFKKKIKSLEKFIQTMKGLKNSGKKMLFHLVLRGFSDLMYFNNWSPRWIFGGIQKPKGKDRKGKFNLWAAKVTFEG